MDIIKNGVFDEFELLLKKMLEKFQYEENESNVELMFNNINFFNEEKNDLEESEKDINSHTRPLRIGFVGGFSTGKSSMINSLLGEEILGVKLEPATAQITELSYGEKFEILEVTQDEDDFLYYNEISLEDYKKNSTSRVNKSKNVSHYSLKYPSKNLSKFTIVDTPGFSSTSKEDDELTKKWIETLDLLIWIFDANKVGDKTEYDKLKALEANTKIVGVINKIDTKSPGVREKIRNEILNEDILDNVFFYSSKKVLDEFQKNELFNNTLESITSEIKYCLNNSETFDINNNSSEITFKKGSKTKLFSFTPIKKTSYTEYYNTLINKIDDVRNNEINLILSRVLVDNHNNFRNLIKDVLLEYHNVFKSDVDYYVKSINENEDLLKKSESIYENLREDFDTKKGASFKVFYTSFFKELCDGLFYKYVDSGVFSDDVFIDMLSLQEEGVKENITEFISEKFTGFLENSFNIYENIISNSIYKEFSEIEKIRNDEYHIINTIVNGLIINSVDSLVGYQLNFSKYETASYKKSLDDEKHCIDLVVPDELLNNSINKVLISDLIHASVEYELSLESEIKELEKDKDNTSEIIILIEKLLRKIN